MPNLEGIAKLVYEDKYQWDPQKQYKSESNPTTFKTILALWIMYVINI